MNANRKNLPAVAEYRVTTRDDSGRTHVDNFLGTSASDAVSQAKTFHAMKFGGTGIYAPAFGKVTR